MCTTRGRERERERERGMHVYVLSYMKQCRSHGLYMCHWEAMHSRPYLPHSGHGSQSCGGR